LFHFTDSSRSLANPRQSSALKEDTGAVSETAVRLRAHGASSRYVRLQNTIAFGFR
jgi:hypothetical protein